MNKKEINIRMLTRAETALYFVEDFLSHHSAKDGAYFRSICILLSYSAELIFKALLVHDSSSTTIESLKKELKPLKHNLIKIGNKIGKDRLRNVGVTDIKARQTPAFVGYVIKTEEAKEVIVEDFTDIRYDFTKNALRNLSEHSEIQSYVDELLGLSKRVRNLNN